MFWACIKPTAGERFGNSSKHLSTRHPYVLWFWPLSGRHALSGTLNFFLKFWNCLGTFFWFLASFLGKRGLPYENIGRDLHFAPVVGPFWSWKIILKNRDLEISIFSNIDELDRIYMASPRGLSGGKTEPPDYILMFSSANVPGITYKMNFGDFCPPFLRKSYLRVPPS